MATTATATPGKTSFVKEFLHDNPQGNTKAVNEAWQAAGFEGTISPTLVNKTRVKLTGKRRRKARTAAKEKAPASKPREATAILGKTNFLKEFLHDNPQGNTKAVNEAWTAAGFDGTISTSLVYKARASLGLTGNLSEKTKKSKAKASSTGKILGRPRKEPTAPVTGQPRGRKSARTLALTELEADIDRLIFRLGPSPGNTCPMGWDFLNCLFPPCWGGLSPQTPFHGGNRHGLSGYFVYLGHAM